MFGTRSANVLQGGHPLLVAAAAGLIAGAVAGRGNKLLDHLVSDRQKRRERRVREGSAHEMAGPLEYPLVCAVSPGSQAPRRSATT